MQDQSYTKKSLDRMIRRSDYPHGTAEEGDEFRETLLSEAVAAAVAGFKVHNPIRKVQVRKKPGFTIDATRDQLVVRKLDANLKRYRAIMPTGREKVAGSLKKLLEESVPYAVVKLDIQSFYESFITNDVVTRIQKIRSLNPHSKVQLRNLMRHYIAMGDCGLPRGVGTSSILSDLMMEDFDRAVANLSNIYYYARYVDDMVILVNPKVRETIVNEITSYLPSGLLLNNKKTLCCVASHGVDTNDCNCYRNGELRIDFLGYEYSVLKPAQKLGKEKRAVRVDIAGNKRKKLKKRMIRAFIAFSRRPDFNLLKDRVRCLSSNFTIIDKNTGKRVLAGIYYGYPLLTKDARALGELDALMRTLILSGHGRLGRGLNGTLTGRQKRELLAFSFSRGFWSKKFANFSMKRLAIIQECWEHD